MSEESGRLSSRLPDWNWGAIGLFVQVLVLAVGGTWVVSEIKASTGKLSTSIVYLGSQIDKLDSSVDKMGERVSENEKNIIRLQAKEDGD